MLLIEDKLSKEIKKLLETENNLRIAVAFIGDGASQLINPQAIDVKIICNLTMGGTNPAEIKKLIKRFDTKNIKQIDNIHAKLYIGSEYAIVGSANMSSNGLGNQPNALREAGYKFKIDQPSGKRSLDWFDNDLWQSARSITEQDLKNAAEKWKRRDRARNGNSNGKENCTDIFDYDFDRDDFPLITWYSNANWSAAEKLIKEKTEDECQKIEDEIGNSVDIDCEQDAEHLYKGRHIFLYRQIGSGLASRRRNNFCSLRSREIVWRNAYYSNAEPDKLIDVMLCDEVSPIFGLDQQPIYDKFRDLINQEKYRLLRDYAEGEECWFHPRIELMRKFWKELKSHFCPN